MSKINFSKLPCYVDIRKEAKMNLDIRFQFANALYTSGHGIDMHALAMKIYNSKGEEEYNERECKMILGFAKIGCSPIVYDSFTDIINTDGVTK